MARKSASAARAPKTAAHVAQRDVARILNDRMRRILKTETSRRSLRTKSKRGFPKRFYWGTASAGHQVHGSGKDKGNWGCWEVSGKRLEQLVNDGVPVNKLHEFVAGNACEFETRFRADFRLLKALGHNTVRFSINWATIEPTRCNFDTVVLENYREMVKEAQRCGLKVVLTLYHWTHPTWFEKAGGWTQSDAAEQFLGMLKVALPYLRGVKIITTLNEPNVYAMFSYQWTEWPPGMGSDAAFKRAFKQLVHAHRLAYTYIKKLMPKVLVGVAMAVNWNSSESVRIKAREDKFFTRWLDIWAAEGLLDVIGIQTYMHSYFDPKGKNNCFGWEGKDPCTPNPVLSDMKGAKQEHWGMCPEAIYHTTKEVWERYRIAVMVTEHGHAISELVDKKRCWYLWESLKWLEKAIAEGVKLIGYLHWSTMDNFEWKYGWGPKFGLIYVNRKTQKRTPRKSAYVYRAIIRAGGCTPAVASRYKKLIKHPHAD